ncbi:MAG: hypothetical protein AAFR45_12355 [Pseudomonadota bacterium]
MTMKTVLAALALTTLPAVAMAECNWGHYKQQAQSCVAGMSWDADKQACVPVASS